VQRLVFAIPALLLLAVSAYAENLTDAEKMSRLRSGDILHEYTRMDESGGAIRAEILIRTKVEDIRAILRGCGKAFIFVDGMEQCEIVERTDTHTLIRQQVDTGLLAPTLRYTYESKNLAYPRMDFKLVEGNLRALEGGWEFVDVQEGVLVTYKMRVQPGFPIPRFLVRMSLRRMIPDMLACIRGLVDGSGSSSQNLKDLDRCPGSI
jgi:ribosome-associated toxin RatA of RatAB toxin-antitoxin module